MRVIKPRFEGAGQNRNVWIPKISHEGTVGSLEQAKNDKRMYVFVCFSSFPSVQPIRPSPSARPSVSPVRPVRLSRPSVPSVPSVRPENLVTRRGGFEEGKTNHKNIDLRNREIQDSALHLVAYVALFKAFKML